MDEVTLEDSEELEFISLVTRYGVYVKNQQKSTTPSASTPLPSRKSNRDITLACSDHKDSPSSSCEQCIHFPFEEKLPNGRLPLTKQVISLVSTMNLKDGKKKSNIHDVASDLILHWWSSNVYTIHKTYVISKLEKVMKNYHSLKEYPKKKRGAKYLE